MLTTTARRWLDAAVWILTAFFLVGVAVSSVGAEPPTFGSSLSERVEHAAAYAGLTFTALLAGAWRPWRGPGPLAGAAWALPVAAFALGAAFEVVQASVPSWNRTGDPLDAAANGAGVAAAVLGWLAWRSRAG